MEQLNSVYSNFDDVVEDISKAYLEVIQQLLMKDYVPYKLMIVHGVF